MNQYPQHKRVNVDEKILRSIKREAFLAIKYASEYTHYLVEGSVKVIPLISPGGKKYRLAGFSNGHAFKETAILKKFTAIANFIHSIPGKKFSCRLSIMDKETEIFPHRDYFRNLEFGVVRLHLPIQTSPECVFNIEEKGIHLNMGYLHFVDISKTHYLTNTSKKSRIHLIIDLEVTKELLEMFNFPKALHKLDYLQAQSLKKSRGLRFATLKISSENLPYPLSLSSQEWKILKEGRCWYFCSGSYKFKIIENNKGSYGLDAVGPGFSFSLSEKTCSIHCSGVTMVGERQIYNGEKRSRVKLL